MAKNSHQSYIGAYSGESWIMNSIKHEFPNMNLEIANFWEKPSSSFNYCKRMTQRITPSFFRKSW